MTHAPLALILLLAACSDTSFNGESAAILPDSEALGSTTLLSGLRLDLVPTELPVDAADEVLLPQSFPLPTLDLSRPFDAGVQDLVAPSQFTGAVVGLATAPGVPVASLPGDDVVRPLSATVLVELPGTVQSYRARTDAEGNFTFNAVPDVDYALSVIPDEPSQPLTRRDIDLRGDDPLDIALDTGAALYGHVEQGGSPIVGATMVAVDDRGNHSAPFTTDESGFFHVALQTCEYALVFGGREFSLDPEITIDVDLSTEGLYQPISLPELVDVLVDGRLLADGQGVAGVDVQLISRSLDGLEAQVATYHTKKSTDADGGFIVRVPAGVYDLTVLPPSTDGAVDFTPVSLQTLALREDVDLGTIPLAFAERVSGTVASPSQDRVPGAVVACREVDFGRRSWTAVSDEDGRFEMLLPLTPVLCAVTPPADRPDLALTRRTFDPSETPTPTLSLAYGQRLVGQVIRGDEPVPYVVVELRDGAGELLGAALSDDLGEWSLQVAP
jgi:hypothetical protein